MAIPITSQGALTGGVLEQINANFQNAGLLTQGQIYWVCPRNGSDGYSGLSAGTPFKSIQKALSAATADQNDIVLLISQGNGADETTNRVSTTIDWNKDLVHLLGVGPGPLVSQRSRVAFTSTYDTASNLFTVSATGCQIGNIQFFAGVAGTNPTGCVKVTGDRNVFQNVHFAGIGNAANDIAGAYSLFLDAADENRFEGCAIGLDTIERGAAANSEILLDGSSARNFFDRCLIFAMISHTTNHPLVKLADATAIDRWLWFRNCQFINESVNYATAQTGIFKLVQDLTQGFIVLENPMANKSDNSTAPKWDVDDRDKIALFNSPTPAADTAGISRNV